LHSLPLHILFVGEYEPDDLGAAGANAHAMLIQTLRSRGVKVTGIMCDLDGFERRAMMARLFSWDRARWIGRYHLHPMAFAARTRKAQRLMRIALNAAPADAVIQYGSAFDAAVPRLAHLMWSDTTAAVTAKEPYSWMGSMLPTEQRLVDAQERHLLSACDIIMPWSQYAGAQIARCSGVPAERMRPTYVGPSVSLESTADARLARSASGGTVRVLFVGREFARKGGDAFVEAVRRVRVRGIDLRAVIVGPEKCGFDNDFVDFVGFLDKSDPSDLKSLRDVYAEADIFCLPTRREPFGIAVVEAMLAGLPVVATKVSAIPEIVEDGSTGYLVEVDDIDRLTDRLAELASDSALRDTMGRRGAASARSRFDWIEVAQRVEDATREAIDLARTRIY